MSTKLLPINHWPRDERGEFILNSTNESIILAHVIVGDSVSMGRVKRWRDEALRRIEFAKTEDPVDYQALMDTAVRAQFLRECIEEVERLQDDRSTV